MTRMYLISYRVLLVLSVGLIALGGATRAVDAGLACPDWPLCFGRFVPDFHAQVYFEFIHRALAGSIGIFVVTLHGLLFFNRRVAREIKAVAALSLAILMAQIVLGGLTVLKLLQSGIVTLHLAFGTAFFISMLWVYLQVREIGQRSKRAPHAQPRALARWYLILAGAIYAQILLGGWVSSNYAGLACQDFPTCNGQWLPPLVGSVGIQVVHRFGAYSVALLIFANLAWVLKKRDEKWMARETVENAFYLASLIVVQICLGVANIKFMIPPLITVLHLLTAVAMLTLTLKIRFFLQDPLKVRSAAEQAAYRAGVRGGLWQRPQALDTAQPRI